MATRWYSEKKREHYYKQAKKDGYRARSAFKLKQIQKRFKILKKGSVVVDLVQPLVDGVRLPRKLLEKTELLLVLIFYRLNQFQVLHF